MLKNEWYQYNGCPKNKNMFFFIFFWNIYDSKDSFLLYGVKNTVLDNWIDRITSYHKANIEDVLLSAT